MTEEMEVGTADAAASVPDDVLGERLNAVLSDPESMRRLGALAQTLSSSGALAGLLGGGQTHTAGAEEDDGEAPHVQKTGGEVRRTPHSAPSRHMALLHALRPYLSTEKQARLDRMVKLLQLAELAGGVLRSTGGE